MVMTPGPWGEALDALATEETTLVVPTPSGTPFTQALARELSTRPHLVFACGRYEGIDQRVVDHARTRMRVEEVSIGDYVLNGGEVAALAIVEAVARLVPGFMGNAASLVEESHEDGLLEHPVYTKPARWRDLDVPPVLLSGDHGAIDRWRHEQSLRRTAERRPDLLRPSSLPRPVRGAARGAVRRRRALHPAARLLGPGGPRQPGRAGPRAARVAGRRAGVGGAGHGARGASGGAAGGCGARLADTATPGTSAG